MGANEKKNDLKMGCFYTAVQLYFDCGTPWAILWCKFSWTAPQKNSSKTGFWNCYEERPCVGLLLYAEIIRRVFVDSLKE